MIKLILFSVFLVAASCTLGFDLSTLTSVDSFKCLRHTENRTFFSVRAWRSYASFDPNSLQTIKNA